MSLFNTKKRHDQNLLPKTIETDIFSKYLVKLKAMGGKFIIKNDSKFNNCKLEFR